MGGNESEIHLMTLNVAGLNNLIKRWQLRLFIKKNRCDIFSCQEKGTR